MKKFLLMLFVAAMPFAFAACNDDDKDQPGPVDDSLAGNIAGSYATNLEVEVNGEETGDPIKAEVIITKVSDETINLRLNDFVFNPVGTIPVYVENIKLTGTKENVVVKYAGKLNIDLNDSFQIKDAPIEIEGTIKNGKTLDLNIFIDAEMGGLELEIDVDATGTKK